jgi:hypothetical protein
MDFDFLKILKKVARGAVIFLMYLGVVFYVVVLIRLIYKWFF